MSPQLPISKEILLSFARILISHFPSQYDETLLEKISTSDLSVNIKAIASAVAMSDFVADVLQKQPHFLHSCWQQTPQLADCEDYRQRLQVILANVDNEEMLYKLIRQFRHREMAKLSFCQTLNLGTVEDIFIRLSHLAESLIIETRNWLYLRACAEMGTPLDNEGHPQQLYILGMGKLGGFELNFSSDIDLIFAYPSNGHTDGARRAVENNKFFTRLGQRLINALSQFTPDGFVYRTDMRLRPFGDSGALVFSFSAMEQYYQEQGRDWERYALIKGRILGQDQEDPHVKTLQQLLRPFVYRRYIDFSVIQALRDMKGKIEREVRRRGLVDNIKLGAGGIREIEFIVQVFQLIRGGREAHLQQHELLKILPHLQQLELLTIEQCEDLRQSYLFLRRTENILQAIKDQQTQVLPTDEKDQLRLVVAMAKFTQLDHQNQVVKIEYPIENWQDFYRTLQHHQQKVRLIFDSLIGEENGKESSDCNSNWCDFLDESFAEDEVAEILQQQSVDSEFHDEIIEKLVCFKQELRHRVIGARGRTVLSRLMPSVLSQVFHHEQCVKLLPRVLNIIDKIVSRTTYLELLLENPQALSQLIELCAKSKMIAEQVARYPILLDELLDRQSLLNPPDFTQYPAQLRQYMLRLPQDDEEQLINGLRQFKQTALLRVAAADILGALPVMKVSDHLTYLAEAIIESVVHFAWKQVTQRFGVPDFLQPNEKGFLVVGYGKLGGIELGYQSDLDLVFLYDNSQTGQTVGGTKVIDSNQFYLRLSRKIVSIFSMNTSAGVLYDVDMRLRPSGEAGLLGCPLTAFKNYQLNEAWTWEKQALVRSRPIFGEERLKYQFDQIRHQVLTEKRNIAILKKDVREMREKMYQHLSNHKGGQFNIKTDSGGITDIEFIAQYLVLAYSEQHQNLTKWSDNVRIFDSLAESAVVPVEICEKLKHCYITLRDKIHHLNLLGLPSVVSAEEFKQERLFITQIWQQLLMDC